VVGGGEQHLLRLARRLAARGDRPTVVTRQSAPDWAREEQLDGIRVLRVPPSGPARSGKYRMLPSAFRRVARELSGHDLLVVRGTRVLGLPALVAARLRGRPVVMQPEVNGELSGEVFTWGTRLHATAGGRLLRAAARLRNRFLRDADAFVAMSHRIADEMRAARIDVERIAHIPHGVDCARFRPATPEERRALRASLSLPADGVIVTYTGRLLKGKGLETLIEAFGRAAGDDAALQLVLVGSGAGQALSIEDALRSSVADAGLDARVRFTGPVDNVEDYLRASDVFALPSEFEGLGLSLVEAAASGLACIGARTGGIVDVIEHERSGLLIAPGGAAELAAALSRLATDRAARESLGAGARAAALARFDERDMVDRYRALFREVARRRPRAAA
jgi:glycosyltransferase involved in cell wall biosynthesis